MNPRRFGPSRPRRAAFTLVELVVSSAAAVILVGGMAAAIVLATHALPDRRGALHETADAAQALLRLGHELACAQSVLQHGAAGVSFTVPDQDGDGAPEIVTYSWSETPGDPLERRFNDAPAEMLLPAVVDFSLDYGTYTITSEGDPTRNESDETQLASWENWLLLTDEKVEANKWRGEVFRPSLPADAFQYRITRVHFYARVEGAPIGMSSVELRPVGEGAVPRSDVLAAAPLPESELRDYFTWYRVEFADAPQIDAGQPVAVAIRHVSDAHSCRVKAQGSSVWDSRVAFVKTDDGGKSWTVTGSKSLLFNAYGTVTTLGPPEVIVTPYLRSVRVCVQAHADTPPLVTTVNVLNEPELAP